MSFIINLNIYFNFKIRLAILNPFFKLKYFYLFIIAQTVFMQIAFIFDSARLSFG